MQDRKTLLVSLGLTILLVGLNLIALNYLVAGWSTGRVDLTSERLYSISPATQRLLTNIDEELTILGYFSQRTHPKLAPLVPEIEQVLELLGRIGSCPFLKSSRHLNRDVVRNLFLHVE